ncbi:MAG TPA: lipopolysaccharide biosynthesis protein [Pyrinomonadaceae bacterium]|nr:lipopolysaccharide biosynthesis protein [Pyrinomonadaceae bacterium]
MSEGSEKVAAGAESVTHRTLSGMFWMVSGSGLQAVLRIGVLVVLARLLDPQEFGVVAAALIVVDFLEIFSDFGMGPAVVQHRAPEERHIRTAFTVSLVLGCIFAAVIWAAAPLAAAFFRIEALTPVMRAMSLVFPLDSLALVSASLLRRDLKFRKLAVISVRSYAVGYCVVGVGAALAGFGVWALVAANLSQTLLSSAQLLWARPHAKRLLFDRATLKEMTYAGGGFSAAHLFNYAALKGDNAVVGRALGVAALGLYTRAYGLMSISVSVFGAALDKVLFAAMSRVQDDPERLTAAFRRGLAGLSLLVLPMSAAMCVLAPELVRVLLGEKWSGVTAPFQVLAAGMLFRNGYKLCSAVARARGAVYRNAWRQGAYAVMVLAGSLAGARWGLTGVAAGVLAALGLHFAVMAKLALSLTQLGWREYLSAHVPALRLTLLLALELWFVVTLSRGVGLAPAATLAAALLSAGATMVVLLRVSPRLALGGDGVWALERVIERAPGRAMLTWWLRLGARDLPGAA